MPKSTEIAQSGNNQSQAPEKPSEPWVNKDGNDDILLDYMLRKLEERQGPLAPEQPK